MDGKTLNRAKWISYWGRKACGWNDIGYKDRLIYIDNGYMV